MKATINRNDLEGALRRVSPVVSKRATLPILANVLLSFDSGLCRIYGTDLDAGIDTSCPAATAVDGVTTVNAAKLSAIVGTLESPEIEIEVDDKSLMSVRAGASAYKLFGLPKDEYPANFCNNPHNHLATLPQQTLKEAIKHTEFAMSTDESRFVLNAMLFHFQDEVLSLVATDGRRLAKQTIPASGAKDSQLIVPTAAVSTLSRLLGDDGEIKIGCRDSSAVRFELTGDSTTVFASKLVEGQYPNYKQVIPADHDHQIKFSREELRAAVRRASLMTSEKSSSLKLHFTKDALTLCASSIDVGDSKENVCVNYRGKELAIAFNADYLREPLDAIDSDEIELQLKDELSPGVIKTESGYLYVIMPMRLS